MEKIQVLGLEEKNTLIAVVHHDLKTHNHVFYKVTKMDADDIKDLFNNHRRPEEEHE